MPVAWDNNGCWPGSPAPGTDPTSKEASLKPPKLTLISHASTDALRRARFPANESLNAAGRRELAAAPPILASRVLTGPEHRAAETAAGLAPIASPDHELRDLDAGRWSGLAMAEVPEPELLAWLTDPSVAPHGGESIMDLIARMGNWLNRQQEPGIASAAVTHPAVIRATLVSVLRAPPEVFWQIDITPLSRTKLHYRNRHWTLRM